MVLSAQYAKIARKLRSQLGVDKAGKLAFLKAVQQITRPLYLIFFVFFVFRLLFCINNKNNMFFSLNNCELVIYYK